MVAPHIEPYWSLAWEDVAVIVATDEPPVIYTKPRVVKK